MVRSDVICLVRNAFNNPDDPDAWATLDEYLWEEVLEALQLVTFGGEGIPL